MTYFFFPSELLKFALLNQIDLVRNLFKGANTNASFFELIKAEEKAKAKAEVKSKAEAKSKEKAEAKAEAKSRAQLQDQNEKDKTFAFMQNVCPLQKMTISPLRAVNANGEWKIVVNIGDLFIQKVVVTMCSIK